MYSFYSRIVYIERLKIICTGNWQDRWIDLSISFSTEQRWNRRDDSNQRFLSSCPLREQWSTEIRTEVPPQRMFLKCIHINFALNWIPLNDDVSLAKWEASRKVSIRFNEIKDWLNTSLEIQKCKQISILNIHSQCLCVKNYFRSDKETYTLSFRSSAILRISNNSTIFPECSRILASPADSRFLNQPSSRLWGLELTAAISPTQNATQDKLY